MHGLYQDNFSVTVAQMRQRKAYWQNQHVRSAIPHRSAEHSDQIFHPLVYFGCAHLWRLHHWHWCLSRCHSYRHNTHQQAMRRDDQDGHPDWYPHCKGQERVLLKTQLLCLLYQDYISQQLKPLRNLQLQSWKHRQEVHPIRHLRYPIAIFQFQWKENLYTFHQSQGLTYPLHPQQEFQYLNWYIHIRYIWVPVEVFCIHTMFPL